MGSTEIRMSSGLDARILVVGAGALGGITTALLWERWMGGATPDATRLAALTTNHAIADAIRARGFRIGGLEPERAIKAPVVESIAPGSPRFDWIVLAVQPPQVEEAARATAEHLAPNGRVICFQNGLCEERVERIVGAGRVVGAVVSWGASMPEPGLYLRTARGGFTLGTLDDSTGASGLEDSGAPPRSRGARANHGQPERRALEQARDQLRDLRRSARSAAPRWAP
jgi:2-dehydropantoate 2-reductase